MTFVTTFWVPVPAERCRFNVDLSEDTTVDVFVCILPKIPALCTGASKVMTLVLMPSIPATWLVDGWTRISAEEVA